MTRTRLRFAYLSAAVIVALSAAAQPLLAQTVEVVEATYGRNCGVPRGNVTGPVAGTCNGRANCRYRVYYRILGDPAYGCEKEFEVYYRCLPNAAVNVCRVRAEAGWGGENGRPNYHCPLNCTRGFEPD